MNTKVSNKEELLFGVDVGGTAIKIGLFNTQGDILDKWKVKTNKEDNGQHILQDISDFINKIIVEKELDKDHIKGIGLGIPGPVKADGTVLECVNLGWGIFNAADKLKELTNFEVKVGNDANVAALGEQWRGGGQGFKSTILFTLGTGVGGGIILDNKIISGSNGAAGEVGHILVNPDEVEKCNCGKAGCLEQYASATGVVRLAKRRLETGKESSLNNVEKINAKVIFDHAKEGDEVALDTVKEACNYLGTAMGHTAAVVDPEAFVIGGGVSNAGEILIKYTEETYNKTVMNALKGKEIKLASLGNDAGMFGCAKMIIA